MRFAATRAADLRAEGARRRRARVLDRRAASAGRPPGQESGAVPGARSPVREEQSEVRSADLMSGWVRPSGRAGVVESFVAQPSAGRTESTLATAMARTATDRIAIITMAPVEGLWLASWFRCSDASGFMAIPACPECSAS